MPQFQEYDAIIVGAGATGAVFAHELTKAGMDVLCIEKGQHFTNHKEDFYENELETFRLTWDYSDYEITGDAFDAGPNLGAHVGGGTLAWTATALRMFERDFRFRSTWGQPAGTNTADWPVSKRMLQRYYNKAEAQMGVAGELTSWDEPGTRPPVNPPMPFYPSSKALQRGFDRLGLRSAPGRVATNSRPYDGRSECLNCGFCRAGCRVDAKYQADEVLIKPALETGRLHLETESVVTHVETARWGGWAKGVHYVNLNSGVETYAKGRYVILCNNPFEIPRLLLSSTSRFHPYGIGNYFDQVGRNFYSHATCLGMGVTGETLNSYVGHSMCNIMSLDTSYNRERNDYVGGFSLLSLHGAGAGSLAAFPLKHLNGDDLRQSMARYNNSMVLIAFIEGMPVYSNRITVNRNKTDDLGMPLPHIHYEWHQNDLNAFEHAKEKIRDVMEAGGSEDVFTSGIFESHPMGTMRMGHNPLTSATDRYGRVHGVPNLFVAGGCLFPTGSSVNPTLTMHALALRSAEKIAWQWRFRERFVQ
ncbi:GMC family oxidoreductase [Marinimicrobium agarilyticum]|uniref:GMC family oxidoreductase n=1 Tax=Marinimicrobium agarilyticum TaxID=306546 RepID=UPI00040BDB68|nr:GMC family oxidoreductase [Marinimicrobium agarilyticum]